MSDLDNMLNPEAIASFRRWKGTFLVRREGLPAWHELVAAKCNPNDLEWALYFAMRYAEIGQDSRHQVNRVSSARRAVLADIGRLKTSLETMVKLKIGGTSAFTLLVEAFEVRAEEERELANFPARLRSYEDILLRIKAPMANLKAMQSDCEKGEILLQSYVHRCTGKFFYRQLSELLEASAEAYGLEGRSFGEDAMSRRYRRFRRYHRVEFKRLRDGVRAIYPGRSVRKQEEAYPLLFFMLTVQDLLISKILLAIDDTPEEVEL